MDNKKVYVDLDDTLVDFTGYILSKDKDGMRSRESVYRILIDNASEVFRNLKLLPGTDFYMSMLRHNHNWHVLTALPRISSLAEFTDDPEGVYKKLYDNKMAWCVKHGIPKEKVHIVEWSKNKKHYCKPGDTLIDDNKENIEDWESKGGDGKLVKKGR